MASAIYVQPRYTTKLEKVFHVRQDRENLIRS
jgi:hypothetical protein